MQQTHFKAVLGHLEQQLELSLRSQTEADAAWIEDLDARSKQQADTILRFDDKCKKLYDQRFQTYVQRTGKKLREYETQFLEVGKQLATEKSKYTSRVKRMKIALGQWKSEYQQDIRRRYNQAAEVVQTRYSTGKFDFKGFVYFCIPVASYLMRNGALNSSHVLLSYHIPSPASPMTNVLISTFSQT